jgi:hypothetical protein
LDHGSSERYERFRALGVPCADECRFIAQIATGWRLFTAGIGVEHMHLHCKGDAMAYDPDSLIQREMRLRQKHPAAMRPAYEQIMLRIEMMVGAWYIDQFGNRTREIKARD